MLLCFSVVLGPFCRYERGDEFLIIIIKLLLVTLRAQGLTSSSIDFDHFLLQNGGCKVGRFFWWSNVALINQNACAYRVQSRNSQLKSVLKFLVNFNELLVTDPIRSYFSRPRLRLRLLETNLM